MAADSGRLAGRLPDWWFPESLVKYFPEGRPLAGAGFAAGLTLYLLAHVLDTLAGLGQVDFRVFVLGLTGQRLSFAAVGLVLAVLMTTSRTRPPTARQQTLDDWTLVVVVALGTIIAVLVTVGFVVQLSDWVGGFLPTLYDLLIRLGALVSSVTSVTWALGRLYAGRSELEIASLTPE